MKSSLVDIACFVRTETPRAWLINDGHREVWIPKSQCEVQGEGKNTVIVMPYWLAHSKELI
jgi:hypothetical protein